MSNYLSNYLPSYVGQSSLIPVNTGTLPMDFTGSAPSVAIPESNWFRDSGFLGKVDANGIKSEGWGMPALGAAKGLFDSWMAMKSYGLAKQQLAEGKRQFGLNFEAQRQTLNTQLEDRQRARLASNPGAYQSLGDYMSKNSIKGG